MDSLSNQEESMLALRRVAVLLFMPVLLSLSPVALRGEPPATPDVLIESAKDHIKARDWRSAVWALQRVLEGDEAAFADRDLKRLAGARREALRLLGSLPPEGRQYYETMFGPVANNLLKEADRRRDVVGYLKVSERFPLTDAGREALREAAEGLVHKEDVTFAALLFERLRAQRPLGEWSDSTLFHAAVALRASEQSAEPFEKELFRRVGPDVSALQAELERCAFRAGPRRNAWLMFGKDVTRSAPASAGTPVLERATAMPLVESQQSIRDRLQTAAAALERAGSPVLPGSFPVAATVVTPDRRVVPLVYYRSYWGLHSFDLKKLKVRWKTPMDWSVEKVVSTTAHFRAVTSWIDWYATQGKRPEVLLENSTIGSLSSDGTYLFAVDDLAVPPPPAMAVRMDDALGRLGFNPDPNLNRQLRGAVFHSKLRAFDLWAGKLRWEVGGEGRDNNNELFDSYFLGPPLPLDGDLHVLTEKEKQFRLVTLDARSGKLLAVLPLPIAPCTRLLADPVRRLEAVHLAYGDGILVCPTNAGTIWGVHRASGKPRWSYTYAEPAPARGADAPPLPAPPKWRYSAPVVRLGNVFFTAPDADAVHCLNLQDGTLVWKHRRRDGDLYFAGVGGDKALIVGSKTVRALRVEDGTTAWTVETGLPSGRGAFGSDGRYYLPLAASAKDGKPAVAALDLAAGTVAALVGADGNEVPGNLIFFNEMLISQTAKELVVYPLAK
jgi:outer membrane protein assembly factor BamB